MATEYSEKHKGTVTIPDPRLKHHQAQLLANAKDAARILERKGFQRICSAMAGLASESCWKNEETEQFASVRVRDWNKITWG
jgi:hypothetical protein